MKGKVPCLHSTIGFSSNVVFNLDEHTLSVTGLAVVPGWDLNPGPLSLVVSALSLS